MKTTLDLCIDEKQHLIQQRKQTSNDIKNLKLRILTLQDQVNKLKRNNQPVTKKTLTNSSSTIKRRIVRKKPKKSCLEILLDQNQSSTFIDDFHNQSSVLYQMSPRTDRLNISQRKQQQRFRTCSLCDCHTTSSLMKRKTRQSTTTIKPKRKC